MRFKKLFLKKDLLALIICALFLSAVCGMVGKRGRDLAKRSVCASNINQLLQGLTILAGENEGILLGESGYWPLDIDYDITNDLLDCIGIDVQEPLPVQDVFYCPSNLLMQIDLNWRWNFCSSYREMGYVFLWSAWWNGNGALPVEGSGNKKFVKTIYVDNPAETELVIDIVMSDARPNVWPIDDYPNGNFARLMCGGMPDPYGFPDCSSHLKTPREPYGGNVGFVDGHVQWRPFSQMERRFYYGSCPVWWW